MSTQHCRMLQVERFFRLSRTLLRHCCRFAQNGNIVEATFDLAERTIFYDKLVRRCCRFWQQCRMLLRQSWTLNVASTSLLVWTGLYTIIADVIRSKDRTHTHTHQHRGDVIRVIWILDLMYASNLVLLLRGCLLCVWTWALLLLARVN